MIGAAQRAPGRDSAVSGRENALCFPLGRAGRTGAETCTVFGLCFLLFAGGKGTALRHARSPRRRRENRREEQSRQAFRQTHRTCGRKSNRETRNAGVPGKKNRLRTEKRRSKEPRRYQPGLSSVLFVHGSSPGVQHSHSGEPLNNSIFDNTAINGSFFFEACHVHCMGMICFRSFLLRNRCRND